MTRPPLPINTQQVFTTVIDNSGVASARMIRWVRVLQLLRQVTISFDPFDPFYPHSTPILLPFYPYFTPILPYARQVPVLLPLQQIVENIYQALGSVGCFFQLMALLVLTFSLMGMNLFGGRN